MKLVWTEPAVASLEAIREYIAHDNAFYAALFVERLVVAGESLTEMPERGRHVPEARREHVRELLFQRYRIIYHVLRDKVEILAVVHGARDLANSEHPPWEIY